MAVVLSVTLRREAWGRRRQAPGKLRPPTTNKQRRGRAKEKRLPSPAWADCLVAAQRKMKQAIEAQQAPDQAIERSDPKAAIKKIQKSRTKGLDQSQTVAAQAADQGRTL